MMFEKSKPLRQRFFESAHIFSARSAYRPGMGSCLFKRAVFIPRRSGSIGLALALLACLCMAVVLREAPEQPVLSYSVANKIIAVDAGHGGFDPGAQRGNIREEDITLAISKKLVSHLSQAGSMVIMTRENKKDLSDSGFSGSLRERKRQDLARRADKANKAKASLFVSIHTNADPSPRWRGAQVFYDGSSQASRQAAEAIQEELTRLLGNTKRKALPGRYYITQHTRMPAVIVEVGFISNPDEGKLLMDPDYQAKVAHAIYAGIVKAQTQASEPVMGHP